MQYFIQTAGSNKNQDYAWYMLIDNGLKKQQPAFIDIAKFYIIDIDAQSLYLGRNNEKHLELLITRIPGNRQDFAGRVINNYLALIAENPEENNLVQGVAARFLQNKQQFAEDIEQCIAAANNEYGFEIDINKLQNVIKECRINPGNIFVGRTITSDNERGKRTKELADELENHTLPNNEGPLIIVTKYIDIAHLKKQPSICRVITEMYSSFFWEDLPLDREETAEQAIPDPYAGSLDGSSSDESYGMKDANEKKTVESQGTQRVNLSIRARIGVSMKREPLLVMAYGVMGMMVLLLIASPWILKTNKTREVPSPHYYPNYSNQNVHSPDSNQNYPNSNQNLQKSFMMKSETSVAPKNLKKSLKKSLENTRQKTSRKVAKKNRKQETHKSMTTKQVAVKVTNSTAEQNATQSKEVTNATMKQKKKVINSGSHVDSVQSKSSKKRLNKIKKIDKYVTRKHINVDITNSTHSITKHSDEKFTNATGKSLKDKMR